MGRFPGQNGLLAGVAPTIVAHHAAAAQYPVTGDQIADQIGPHRAAHGPAGPRLADPPGHIPIAHRPSGRNAQQRLPDFDLEVGPPHVEVEGRRGDRERGRRGDGETRRRGDRERRRQGEDLSGDGGGASLVLYHIGPRPTLPQRHQSPPPFSLSPCLLVSLSPHLPLSRSPPLLVSLSPPLLVFLKREPAHPTLGHADPRRAEGGGVDACADGEAGPPLFDLARGHGVQGHHQIVEPSRPGEPGRVGRVQHVFRALEQALGVGCGQVLHKALGADPRPAAEETLKVMLAQPHLGRHRGQIRLGLVVGLQIGDGPGDQSVVHCGLGGGLGWVGVGHGWVLLETSNE